MRNVRLAMGVGLACVIPSLLFGQGGNSLSIANYQLVNQQSVNSTQSRVTYRADLVNPGGAFTSVSATVASLNPFIIRTLPGQDTLNFAPVPANSQVTSNNTFTILVTGAVPPDFTILQWSFQTTAKPVIANRSEEHTSELQSP